MLGTVTFRAFQQALVLPVLLPMLVLVMVTACQTPPRQNTATNPALKPATVYSGYFIWDAERTLGAMAVQCVNLVFEKEEILADGTIRLTGVSRYITGAAREINFVDAELLFDPAAGTFLMWERNATSESFVSDGKFVGFFQPDMLFMKGVWQGENSKDSGQLFLRQGADAPCRIAADA